jgi:pyruvate dehydrogenase E2 component (dihydrolipoamide acetyltransferase)
MSERKRTRHNRPEQQGRSRQRSGSPHERPRRRRGGTEQGGGEQPQHGTEEAHSTEDAPSARDASDQQPSTAAERGSERSTPVATEVTIPQLGESVTEGTITAWLKDVGDTVEVDEPLFELSSDKIDTEVPSPAAGVLSEIKVDVDETVDVGTVVAIIGGEEEGDSGGEAEDGDAEDTEEDTEQEDTEQEGTEQEGADEGAQEESADEEGTEDEGADEEEPDEAEEGRPALASPLVRRLAEENDVDLASLSGSGQGGRITREDVEAAMSGEGGGGEQGEEEKGKADEGDSGKAAKGSPQKAPQPQRRPDRSDGERSRTEDLSRIRQRIAAKMMESMQSSAQLTTVQEADVTGIMRARAAGKDDFKSREGVSLSPFVFLCRATILALRNHPKMSAQADWDAGTVTYHDYVNLGLAVDTEKGLIVPNIKGADDLSIAGLARAISDAANKARGKGKLEISDIEGATFTMTNTGSVGVLIDTPILNYPEVAILGTGAIKKRPVVTSDESGPAIAIRDMMYLSLTYDHRLIDGADAARFVTEVKDIVETHDWHGELGI